MGAKHQTCLSPQAQDTGVRHHTRLSRMSLALLESVSLPSSLPGPSLAGSHFHQEILPRLSRHTHSVIFMQGQDHHKMNGA